MSRVELANGGAVAVVLALAAVAGGFGGGTGAGQSARGPGEREVVDATGARIPVRAYARVLSASPVADHLLLDLYEADRVVAVTAYTVENDVARHRFAGRATVTRLDDLEAVLALRPDLVVVNNVADRSRVQRLRDAGLVVLDLGPMTGLETLLDDVRLLSRALAIPERGERVARSLERRVRAVAAGVEARPDALYVSVFADALYGGAAGSPQHDLLTYAGLTDAAAEAGFTGWPRYDAEQLLAIDPSMVVTKPGMDRLLCRRPGLHRLRVCRGEGRFLVIAEDLLDATGPTMLDAIEAIHDAAFGDSVVGDSVVGAVGDP